ncbi:MAG: hypothetical protein A2381_05130 [Bdellovibrionales bacterium RIFOXYB1_FULL_37_110]|nr:MAG: hypothetical protein A2417_16610 [Bdellovibrionales bacterium RIFOXYC1_FULL_37_79]OFZ58128.1 MAG: hypothetical protein A2381_05130 [Bdellovibrionales bacterium RIFOXYB1_FULL_37_110]OFZ61817.1 MAG: hypothetical protein A2577_18715 [Bdellovibrionales bacterium RIFOXYD1_FULL_36_51]
MYNLGKVKFSIGALKMAKAKSLIVVDDDDDIREIFVNALSKLKINILEAANGEEALKIIKKNNIVLIISDLNMPVMDGVELLYEVRENLKSSVPLIFTSAYTDNLEKRKLEMTNVSFLKKPFTDEQLVNKVKEIILVNE